MALAAIQVTVELTEINCGKCGGTYAINERYRKQKYEDSSAWHCPYCQCSWGYVKGENAQLREQIESERKRTQLALQRENEERAEKDRLARKLKRVNRGVCPECNRSFQNIARHMACKHSKTT